MAIKKSSAKHNRKTGRRRSARRRSGDSVVKVTVTATPGPYRDFQRDYASALWL